jgi:hypothetical protein
MDLRKVSDLRFYMCRMGFGSILVSTGNPSVPAPFFTESLGEGAKVHTSARRLCGEIYKPAVYDRFQWIGLREHLQETPYLMGK